MYCVESMQYIHMMYDTQSFSSVEMLGVVETFVRCFISENFEVNNNGPNVNLLVNKSHYINIPENKLKTILFFTTRDMEEAFGFQKYDFGEGHQIFKTNLCPDPRCIATANRSYLKSVEDFDAVIIHQRAYNVCIYKYFNNKNLTTYLTIQ